MLAVRSDMQCTGEWGSLGIAHAEDISLNNNRGNNRRRGRGNNRQQGGQPVNRIDSRARGNAQQLLDKYRKMAHDAHLNGDRVQEEYYLQFADHYFRVLADQRARQDESRVRRDDRPQDGSERVRYDDSRGRYDYEYGDETGEDEPVQTEARDAREPRGEDRDRSGYDVDSAGTEGVSEGREGEVYEAPDNPFVRETRAPRAGGRTRAPRRDSRNDEGEGQRHDENEARPEAGVDPSVLPPSIGLAVEDVAEEAAPKPRRRTRKPRATDGNDESLEAVG
jgi:hypothetical protein